MRFPTVPQHLVIEWLSGLARIPIGGRPVVLTGAQVSVFSGRLHRVPRTYPGFWAGLRALKPPIYPFLDRPTGRDPKDLSAPLDGLCAYIPGSWETLNLE